MHRALAILVAMVSPALAGGPSFPEPTLGPGEVALKGVFPSVQHWLSSSGAPVTIQAFLRRGRIVIRGYVADKQQELVTSSFGDAELAVFDHENGKTIGVQLHRYISGAPDKYEGWVLALRGDTLAIVRTTAFNGKQPQPAWLVDTISIKNYKGVQRSVQVLRWAAYTGDRNAYGKYFDGEPVKLTRRTRDKTTEETIAGTGLLASFTELPQLAHAASCKALCCSTDGPELAPYVHIARVCFDGEPTDITAWAHVRAIELVQP